jgi:hypothetical protein
MGELRVSRSLRDDTPERRLGVAVIEQALRDATLPLRGRQTANIRQDARTFLMTDSEDREFWCQLAGIDPTALVRKLEELHGQE